MSTRVDPVGTKVTPGWLRNPGVVAGLWLLATGLSAFDQIRFPAYSEGIPYVSSVLYLSAAPVLSALLAAFITRLWDRALALAGLLLLVDCVAILAWVGIEFALAGSNVDPQQVGPLIELIALGVSLWLVGYATGGTEATSARRVLAILATLLVLTAWPAISRLDQRLMALSAQLSPPTPNEDLPPDIDQERLWTIQPSLVAKALAQVSPPVAGTNVYLVSVAAGGSQRLFGREAQVARTTLGRAFEAQGRSVLLANDEESLFHFPLASTSNLDAVLSALGHKADSSRDLFILYLVSHGGRGAELTTDLPDYREIQAIGAKRLVESLKRAGIRRRVVIISACYAGSWIKPLATDDTIVIAAARADRNSFGCSDERELTYFGEAFLKTPAASGASLAERFEIAKRAVAKWEAKAAERPSEPQAFVGKNMEAIWKAPPSGTTEAASSSARTNGRAR